MQKKKKTKKTQNDHFDISMFKIHCLKQNTSSVVLPWGGWKSAIKKISFDNKPYLITFYSQNSHFIDKNDSTCVPYLQYKIGNYSIYYFLIEINISVYNRSRESGRKKEDYVMLIAKVRVIFFVNNTPIYYYY